MGKNKRSTISFYDSVKKESVEIDSSEEWYVYSWILECVNLGIIKEYEYQPKEFQLTDKFTYIPAFNNPKQKEKHLLADHVYTADFKLKFNKDFGPKLSEFFKIPTTALDQNGDPEIWMDVKGGFNRFAGDRNFSIHQKMVWDKYKIYVQKVVPVELFKKLGAPKTAQYTIKKQIPTKKFVGCESIEKTFCL